MCISSLTTQSTKYLPYNLIYEEIIWINRTYRNTNTWDKYCTPILVYYSNLDAMCHPRSFRFYPVVMHKYKVFCHFILALSSVFVLARKKKIKKVHYFCIFNVVAEIQPANFSICMCIQNILQNPRSLTLFLHNPTPAFDFSRTPAIFLTYSS